MTEKITVIVPVYNVENYLEKCLDSLINQTYKNLEIIVINDGSTDNSINILKNLISNNHRCSIISQKMEGYLLLEIKD